MISQRTFPSLCIPSRLAPRRIRLKILVHPEHPFLCAETSSSGSDGCDSLMRDEDGEALCGAFRVHLKEADDPHWQDGWHVRCQECLDAEEQN